MSRLGMMAVLLTGTVIGVVGCGSTASDAPRGGTLTDARWALATYAADGEQTDVAAGVSSDIQFAEKRAAGAGGVNQFTAPYTATDEGDLEFGDIAATLMAGPEDATAVESAVFAALKATASYFADDKTLTMYDKDGDVLLVYEKDEAGLAGVDWVVTGYNNGKQAVQSTIAGTDLTARFGEDGKVTGFAGVNDYNGTYTTEAASIEIGPLATTRMAGDPALMEQETLYLSALQGAATYSLRGDTLELRNAEDATAVTYKRK